MSLKDKVFVVTGAAAGIGLACAQEFAVEGGKVVLSDIDDEKGQAATEEIRKSGGDAIYIHTDASSEGEINNLIAKSVEAYGKIDCVVPNAGVVHLCDYLDLVVEDFDRVMNINLRGVFLTGQAAARQMVAQGHGGTIINMSSVNSVLAIPNTTSYAVSKGGVSQLTKIMALALVDYDIRVNAIGPGTIKTDVMRAVATNKEVMHKMMSRTPMGRAGETREVARVAVFLASDDSSYITGQTIFPDGGRMALNYTVPVKD